MLIFDCYELLERKQYMHCVLNLATAYETFFSLFLRVELLYKPFAAEVRLPSKKLEQLKKLSRKLEGKIKGHAFKSMRALFLRQIIDQRPLARFMPV